MTDVDAAGGEARLDHSRPAPPVRALAPTSAALADLLPQLSVDRSATRCAAVNRLSRSPHAPFVVEPLIALLKDDDRGVRRAALSALAESGDARAVAPLRALMKGGESLREDAGRALGQLERRLAGRGGDARNSDAPQAIQTAREIREAIAARKLRLRSQVRKGVRLKLASLPLWVPEWRYLASV
jgi:HEAT repeat protein